TPLTHSHVAPRRWRRVHDTFYMGTWMRRSRDACACPFAVRRSSLIAQIALIRNTRNSRIQFLAEQSHNSQLFQFLSDWGRRLLDCFLRTVHSPHHVDVLSNKTRLLQELNTTSNLPAERFLPRFSHARGWGRPARAAAWRFPTRIQGPNRLFG